LVADDLDTSLFIFDRFFGNSKFKLEIMLEKLDLK